MTKMVVGIDYTDDGSRVISRLSYNSLRSDNSLNQIMDGYKYMHDEAYIVDFDPSYEPFINEIVTKGCRVF